MEHQAAGRGSSPLRAPGGRRITWPASRSPTCSCSRKCRSDIVLTLPRSCRSPARRRTGSAGRQCVGRAQREWARASPASGWPAERRAGRRARVSSTRSNPSSLHQLECAPEGGAAPGQDADRLFAHPLAGEAGRVRRVIADGRLARWIEPESKRLAKRTARTRRRGIFVEALQGPRRPATARPPGPRRPERSTSRPLTLPVAVPLGWSRVASSGSQAMALIVKSRRARSSARDVPQRTASGGGGPGSLPRRGMWSPGSPPAAGMDHRDGADAFSQVEPWSRSATASGGREVAISQSTGALTPHQITNAAADQHGLAAVSSEGWRGRGQQASGS